MTTSKNASPARSTAYGYPLPSYHSLPSAEIELTDYSGDDVLSPASINERHQPQPRTTWIRRIGTTAHPIHVWEVLKEWPRVLEFRIYLVHLVPITIIAGLIALICIMYSPSSVFGNIRICSPDGEFSLTYENYSPWNGEAAFAINLSYGSFEFGIAKLIDIIWDVVVGRGGQAFFAITTYRVFTQALTCAMESSAVSADAFEAITLQHDTTLGLWKLLTHFRRNSTAHAKTVMFCIILSSLFTIALPTWLSAMTGYTADIGAFIQDTTGNFVPAADFLPLMYIIHDGSRLGEPYTDDYHVTATASWDSAENLALGPSGYGCMGPSFDDSLNLTWPVEPSDTCQLLYMVSLYTSTYGFLGQNDNTSQFTFADQTYLTILPPSLNISYYPVESVFFPSTDNMSQDSLAQANWASYLYGCTWESNLTDNAPFNNANPMFYHASSGATYDLDQLNDNGICQQPRQVRYKWGFSYALLYAFLITWLIWTIIMYGLYLDSYYNSRLNANKRRMGLKRAVLDLSNSRQKYIESEKSELFSDAKLSSITKGCCIDYKEIVNDAPLPRRSEKGLLRTLLAWTRFEIWWLGLLVIFILFVVLSWTDETFSNGWWPQLSFLPLIGILIVLTLARRQRRRWIHFAVWFVGFWIGNIWWIVQNAPFM